MRLQEKDFHISMFLRISRPNLSTHQSTVCPSLSNDSQSLLSPSKSVSQSWNLDCQEAHSIASGSPDVADPIGIHDVEVRHRQVS
ncbi:unnamed protein product, partial [Protopolystoma xenopodis]